MMIVKIEPTILNRAEVWYANLGEGINIRPGFISEFQETRPRGFQYLRHRAEHRFYFRLADDVDAERMTRTRIRFDRGKLIRYLFLTILGVSLATHQAVFF